MTGPTPKPRFFKTAADLRAWLERNHDSATELWVGYYKKGSGKPSISYPESVDQAICFGWIDGVRHSIDDARYRIRFTPRRSRSIWSAVNIRKATELTKQGLMHNSGSRAFTARTEDRSEVYSFESKRQVKLERRFANKLAADKKASTFFEAQIPSYRKVVIHWVMSAKKEETRANRLEQLITDSAKGLWIAPLRRAQRKK